MTSSHPDQGPKRTVLYQQEHFEIVEIDWTDSTKTEFHDHGWSQCIVEILDGQFENHLDTHYKTEKQILTSGMTLVSPPGSDHQLSCLSKTGKTLHVYVPKIKPQDQRNLVFSKNLDVLSSPILSLGGACKIDQLQSALNTIEDGCVSTWSEKFMNQLFSGVSPYALLTDAITSRTRTTLATIESSPVYSQLENNIVKSLGQLIGFSENSSGIGVPGGSAANFMALHLSLINRYPDYAEYGHQGQKQAVFVSDQAHYSIRKAARSLGLGSNSVVQVHSLADGRMCPKDLSLKINQCLEENIVPLMVVATAGTTVAGAFDNIEEIYTVSQKHKLWLHVDGAWGGPILFSKSHRHLLGGIHLADSVTFDAHKLFGSTLTCSYLLVKDPQILRAANNVDGADYLFHSDQDMDLGKLSWQCGRGMNSLSFWAMWKHLGTDGMGEFVDRMLELRSAFVEWLKTEPQVQLVYPDPEFLNVCFRIVGPDGFLSVTESREQLRNQNQYLINYFTDQTGSYYRFILAHPKLDLKKLKEMVHAILTASGLK